MKKSVAVLFTIAGLVLAVLGLLCVKGLPALAALENLGVAFPYICIGVGCGLFGHGMSEIIRKWALKNSPEIEKQMEIEKNDERNQRIADRAKAKAYDAMVYIFGALMLSFGLMKIATHLILMLVFAYLLVIGISIYYRIKYDKEM